MIELRPLPRQAGRYVPNRPPNAETRCREQRYQGCYIWPRCPQSSLYVIIADRKTPDEQHHCCIAVHTNEF